MDPLGPPRKTSRVGKWLSRMSSGSSGKTSPSVSPPSSPRLDYAASSGDEMGSASGTLSQQPSAYEKTPDKAPSQSLWEEAKAQIDDEERRLLDQNVDMSSGNEAMGDTPHMLQALIQKQQRLADEKAWKFEFGGRMIILRDVFEKISGWISTFKTLGGFVSQIDPIHAALPWAAVNMILQIVTSDTEQNGQVLVAIELVTCLMNRGRIYESLYLDAEVRPVGNSGSAVRAADELHRNVVLMYGKVLSLLATYIKITSTSTVVRAFKAALDAGGFADMLSELGRLEGRCEAEANSCERHVSLNSRVVRDKSLREIRDMLKTQMEVSEANMTRFWEKLDEEERSRILQWISEVPFESDHYNATQGRVKGTGTWLLEHDTYRSWRAATVSTVMWLHGIPGAGKTKLSTRVVDGLKRYVEEAESDVALAYFFCDRNRVDHSDPVVVLRCLVRQLCSQSEESAIIPYVEAGYVQRKRRGFSKGRFTREECHEMLLRLVNDHAETNIAIDGLDELNRETRHLLMDVLDDVTARARRPVKIYIASRQDQDLRDRYESRGHLEVTANDNQADIEKFVLDKLEQSAFCQTKMTSKVRQEVLRVFQDKSQGMFQWAALHIDELLHLKRNKDILGYLDKLPRGLEAAYHRIFDDISSQSGSKRDIAIATFKILMVCYRPLSPEEMVIAATQVAEEDFCLDPDVDIDYVRDACHNFIVVADGLPEINEIAEQPEPRKRRARVDDVPSSKYEAHLVQDNRQVRRASICRFSHLSVREYLEQNHWTSAEAQAFMACICLKTVMRFRFDDPVSDHYPEECGDDDEEKEVSLILKVRLADESSKKQLIWDASDEDLDGATPEDCTSESNPTAFICYVDTMDVHHHDAISECESVRMEAYIESHRDSPLELWARYAASYWPGHVAETSHGDSLWAILQMAIAEFLASTSLEVQGRRTALDNGSSSDAYRAWYLFVKNAFDFHWAWDYRPLSNPLIGCVILGLDEPLMTWTQQGGSCVGMRNSSGDSLLSIAVGRGRTNAARILLGQEGADPNEMNAKHMRPLQQAVKLGNRDLVRLLLDSGADPNARRHFLAENDAALSPMAISASNRESELVAILQEKGADVTVDALLESVKANHFKLVKTLLAAFDTKNPWRQMNKAQRAHIRAWEVAITHKADNDILSFLLDRQTSAYQTRGLILASACANIPAILWLLERGLDVNARVEYTEGDWSRGETALMKAAAICDPESFPEVGKVLLGNGAKLDDVDPEGRRALTWAVLRGATMNARCLLDWGADVHSKDTNGRSLLHLACEKNARHEAPSPMSMVQMLLAYGATVDGLSDHYYGCAATPLYVVIESSRSAWERKLTQVLVEAGATYKVGEIPSAMRESMSNPEAFEARVRHILPEALVDARDEPGWVPTCGWLTDASKIEVDRGSDVAAVLELLMN